MDNLNYQGFEWKLLGPRDVDDLADSLDRDGVREWLGGDSHHGISKRLKGLESQEAFAVGIEEAGRLQGYAALIRYRGPKADLQMSIFVAPELWGKGAFEAANSILWQASLIIAQPVIISIDQLNEHALDAYRRIWPKADFELIDEWWYPRLAWVGCPEDEPDNFVALDGDQQETLTNWVHHSLDDNWWKTVNRAD